MGKGSPEPAVYQFKVTLKGIRPPIWRRFQVTNDITLHRLHLVLQTVMGWENYHLYDFTIDGVIYGEHDEDYDLVDRSSRHTKLWQVLPGAKARFAYRYDFGDNWEHEVVLEKALPFAAGVRYPVCLTGRRACPPEDCGGPWGYERMLEALGDPEDQEHEEYMRWLGGEFDTEAFDLEAVNRALERHRKKTSPSKGADRPGTAARRRT